MVGPSKTDTKHKKKEKHNDKRKTKGIGVSKAQTIPYKRSKKTSFEERERPKSKQSLPTANLVTKEKKDIKHSARNISDVSNLRIAASNYNPHFTHLYPAQDKNSTEFLRHESHLNDSADGNSIKSSAMNSLSIVNAMEKTPPIFKNNKKWEKMKTHSKSTGQSYHMNQSAIILSEKGSNNHAFQQIPNSFTPGNHYEASIFKEINKITHHHTNTSKLHTREYSKSSKESQSTTELNDLVLKRSLNPHPKGKCSQTQIEQTREFPEEEQTDSSKNHTEENSNILTNFINSSNKAHTNNLYEYEHDLLTNPNPEIEAAEEERAKETDTHPHSFSHRQQPTNTTTNTNTKNMHKYSSPSPASHKHSPSKTKQTKQPKHHYYTDPTHRANTTTHTPNTNIHINTSNNIHPHHHPNQNIHLHTHIHGPPASANLILLHNQNINVHNDNIRISSQLHPPFANSNIFMDTYNKYITYKNNKNHVLSQSAVSPLQSHLQHPNHLPHHPTHLAQIDEYAFSSFSNINKPKGGKGGKNNNQQLFIGKEKIETILNQDGAGNSKRISRVSTLDKNSSGPDPAPPSNVKRVKPNPLIPDEESLVVIRNSQSFFSESSDKKLMQKEIGQVRIENGIVKLDNIQRLNGNERIENILQKDSERSTHTPEEGYKTLQIGRNLDRTNSKKKHNLSNLGHEINLTPPPLKKKLLKSTSNGGINGVNHFSPIKFTNKNNNRIPNDEPTSISNLGENQDIQEKIQSLNTLGNGNQSIKNNSSTQVTNLNPSYKIDPFYAFKSYTQHLQHKPTAEGREREGKGKNLQLYDMNEKIQNKTAFPKLNSNVTPPEIRQYFHGVEKPNSLTYPKQIYAKGKKLMCNGAESISGLAFKAEQPTTSSNTNSHTNCTSNNERSSLANLGYYIYTPSQNKNTMFVVNKETNPSFLNNQFLKYPIKPPTISSASRQDYTPSSKNVKRLTKPLKEKQMVVSHEGKVAEKQHLNLNSLHGINSMNCVNAMAINQLHELSSLNNISQYNVFEIPFHLTNTHPQNHIHGCHGQIHAHSMVPHIHQLNAQKEAMQSKYSHVHPPYTHPSSYVAFAPTDFMLSITKKEQHVKQSQTEKHHKLETLISKYTNPMCTGKTDIYNQEPVLSHPNMQSLLNTAMKISGATVLQKGPYSAGITLSKAGNTEHSTLVSSASPPKKERSYTPGNTNSLDARVSVPDRPTSHSSINGTFHNQNPNEYADSTYQETTPIPSKVSNVAKYMNVLNSNKYKYIVCKGNNSKLIKRMMEGRYWWIELPMSNSLFNFKWQPCSNGLKYETLQSISLKRTVNHFEFHKEISRKSNLFRNLQIFSEINKENVFNFLPITFFVEINPEKAQQQLGSALQSFSHFFQVIDSKESKKRACELFDRKSENTLDATKCGIKSPQSNSQGGNSRDSRLKQPITKLKPQGVDKKSCSQYAKYTMPLCHFIGNNIWLLKPTSLNRGRGIHIFHDYETLKNLILSYCVGKKEKLPSHSTYSPSMSCKKGNSLLSSGKRESKIGIHPITQIKEEQHENDPTSPSRLPIEASPSKTRECEIKMNTFIIQKYIENPMLINNRKFDIRVWVLVTHELDCFFFREGYLRTSCKEYEIDMNNIDDALVHLTNNAVQKWAENYGQFEDGNQLSFAQLQDYFDQNMVTEVTVSELVLQMKNIIKKTLFSIKRKLNKENRKYCFEIFGYDFFIDADYNLWLIEVNTNPCLEESSNLLKMLLPRMIDDALKITIDTIYPPLKKSYFKDLSTDLDEEDAGKEKEKGKRKTYPFPGYTDNFNLWEKICSLYDTQYQSQIFPCEVKSEYMIIINERRNMKIRKKQKGAENNSSPLKEGTKKGSTNTVEVECQKNVKRVEELDKGRRDSTENTSGEEKGEKEKEKEKGNHESDNDNDNDNDNDREKVTEEDGERKSGKDYECLNNNLSKSESAYQNTATDLLISE